MIKEHLNRIESTFECACTLLIRGRLITPTVITPDSYYCDTH